MASPNLPQALELLAPEDRSVVELIVSAIADQGRTVDLLAEAIGALNQLDDLRVAQIAALEAKLRQHLGEPEAEQESRVDVDLIRAWTEPALAGAGEPEGFAARSTERLCLEWVAILRQLSAAQLAGDELAVARLQGRHLTIGEELDRRQAAGDELLREGEGDDQRSAYWAEVQRLQAERRRLSGEAHDA